MVQKKGCKDCGDDLFCGVNMPETENPEAMSDLEKKHVPVISAPGQVEQGECFEVTVELGKYLDHPNEAGHFINFVELYVDDTYLGRSHFVHTKTCPVAKFCVSLDHAHENLRAFAYCNLHGSWEGDKPIEVK